MGTEIHSMPHILRLGENLPNDVAAPVIRVGELLLAFPDTLVLFAKVDRRRVDLVIKQDAAEANGDIDKAMEIIRKKGQAVAAKRSDREASEGCVLAKKALWM